MVKKRFLHRNLLYATAKALQKVLMEKEVYAGQYLKDLFKQNKQWGKRDRTFIADYLYDCLRNYRLLKHLCDLHIEPLSEKDYVGLVACQFLIQEEYLPDWEEFAGFDISKILFDYVKLKKQDDDLFWSIPEWLYQWDKTDRDSYQQHLLKECKAMHKQAAVYLRINTLKTTREEVKQTLFKENNIETEILPSFNTLLKLKGNKSLTKTAAYQKGWFEIQDLHSQEIVRLLEIQTNQNLTVIDACAGAGGKTLHIASMIQNKGQIIALDVEARKLKQLEIRAKRAGVKNLTVRLLDKDTSLKDLYGKADRLLLDVPCSGLGVLKRKPETKSKLSPDDLKTLLQTQADILNAYAPLLKPGGKMVYATCSILSQENEEQIRQFLSQNKDTFSLLQEQYFLPSQTDGDGFYGAVLVRE